MDRIAIVDKLREKAGVSYEEAKVALEQSDWDLLDAIVRLEKEGKVKEAAYSTKQEAPPEPEAAYQGEAQKPRGETFDRLFKFIGRVIHKGNTNHLWILQHGEKKVSLPLTAAVLLGIVLPWGVIPLLIIGLFFGFHYRIVGPDLGKTGINDVMDKASKAAEAVKVEFKDVVADKKDDANQTDTEDKNDQA